MPRPEIWLSLAHSKKATNFPTRRYPNEGDNGRTEALPTDRTDLATKGSPNGGNTYGDRVLIVAQRLGYCPGHGEGGQVAALQSIGGVRRDNKALLRLEALLQMRFTAYLHSAGTGEPDASKRGLSGSGGGGWIPFARRVSRKAQ
jgi:hypothetical protein